MIRSIKTNIVVNTIKISESGDEEKALRSYKWALGFCRDPDIHFIFLFGTQVMRGIMEEKTNRIVEVIISSVKPFELMMGKIIGVAMVGLTQFALWIILTLGIVTVVQTTVLDMSKLTKSEQMFIGQGKALNKEQLIDISEQMDEGDTIKLNMIVEAVNSINYGVMIVAFYSFS